jgi:hypothetical protein
VVEHGGWPSWVDESVIVKRVTPLGLHALTPATSPGNKKFIAVATRRWRVRQLQKKIRPGLSRVYPSRPGSVDPPGRPCFAGSNPWLFLLKPGPAPGPGQPGPGSTRRAGPGFKTMLMTLSAFRIRACSEMRSNPCF